jgi:HPt (histidine-containing phosphotransfer) domain-containing protein
MSDCIEINNFMSDRIDKLTDVMDYLSPNLTYLNELADGDEIFIKEIITYFVKNSPETLLSIKENALSGDYKKLRSEVHKLLPQLTCVGILAAIPYFEKIERECNLNDSFFVELERAIKIINHGVEDLKKMI